MSQWIIIDRLADIILRNTKGCLVEIGMGRSTPILAKHANQARTTLYSCDIDPVKVQIKSPSNHVIFEGTSFDFMDQFKEAPALVFIDGCHKYEVVRKEAFFFLNKMVPGGVMFLHDTLPPNPKYVHETLCGTVYKLRHDLENDPKLDCFTWPYTANNCGLTMVIKKPECCVDV